ncbi:MAG: ROK family protein [Dehalococcoidia bacterium]|nr:MAG: ROK family protein [Dehalococcoidia bacterium]
MRHVLAADIGGTQMRAAVVREDSAILARVSAPTLPGDGFDAATERLSMMFQQVAARALAPDILAIGISTAGPVDPTDGTYRHPPNLEGWHGSSMAPLLTDHLGMPVRVGHDATLAALAETRWGARSGSKHLLYLTVSTGIGAGIIVDGRPVIGASGGAGEVGHMIVAPGGASCGAGCPGCLEGNASGRAIALAAAAAIDQGAQTVLVPGSDAAAVFAAADDGDPVADTIVRGAMGHLAAGIAGLLAIFDPQAIIVGGGIAEGFAPRWDALIEAIQERALPRYSSGVPVERTTLGDEVGLLGAALWALGEE